MNNERKKNEENAATNGLLSNMEDITTMKNAVCGFSDETRIGVARFIESGMNGIHHGFGV